MTRRKVTHTRKRNGRVVALGNLEEWWHPRQAIDAIVDIDAKVHRYGTTSSITNGGSSRFGRSPNPTVRASAPRVATASIFSRASRRLDPRRNA